MDPMVVRQLLEAVQAGKSTVTEALEELRELPFRDLGFASVDHHRALRNGVPEVVFGEGKTSEQIAAIALEIASKRANALITRIDAAKAAAVTERVPALRYAPVARTAFLEVAPIVKRKPKPVVVVTAGTSDIPVAEEAIETLTAVGLEAQRVYDVGVAGLHRLLGRLDALQRASALVVCAGMEGALASVVGGMVAVPVVAVPTSIGYGTALGGFTPLFAMLTSCASGVVVVNIDSGFGAAMAVHRMLPKAGGEGSERA